MHHSSQPAHPCCNRFQILALDGGGIRGLFSASILAKWEETHGQPIADHFDLITGTSTGGIIAIALGLGIAPREIVTFYRNHGPRIFPGGLRKPFRWIRHWNRSKFSAEGLQAALEDVFKAKLIGHSRKRLVIPSFDLGNGAVRVFKTAHAPELANDHHWPAWKVAMATTAAPTYLPAFLGLESRRLIDGGVWANNPALVGVVEAVAKLGHKLDQIHVLSIGTTEPLKAMSDKLDRGGKLSWAAEAADVIMRGQSMAADGQVQLLLSDQRYLRVNPKVPSGVFSLDYCDHGKLMAAAIHEALTHEPQVRARFFNHVASEFIPLLTTNT